MILPNPNTLRIVCYPDPVLKKKCAPVEDYGPSLRALAARMFRLTREAAGIALAAPQVGVPIRLFVCNMTGEPADELVFVNPRLVELRGSVEQEEGCLSLPGVTVVMRRATRVVLEARNPAGQPVALGAENLQARVWQHEADHLDGRLIIDHMSPTDEIANRRILRQLRGEHVAPRRF